MFAHKLRVFLAPGATDLRKSINGLSMLVENQMELKLFSGDLFAFCNRSRTLVKLLYWDHNGFCLWMKRLEKEKFRWPSTNASYVSINHRELSWLLAGLNLLQKRAHNRLHYSSVS